MKRFFVLTMVFASTLLVLTQCETDESVEPSNNSTDYHRYYVDYITAHITVLNEESGPPVQDALVKVNCYDKLEQAYTNSIGKVTITNGSKDNPLYDSQFESASTQPSVYAYYENLMGWHAETFSLEKYEEGDDYTRYRGSFTWTIEMYPQ